MVVAVGFGLAFGFARKRFGAVFTEARGQVIAMAKRFDGIGGQAGVVGDLLIRLSA
jgi:hypothetical protein